MQPMRLVATAALLGVTVACTDVSSDSVLTSGMWADLAATADGEGQTEVSAVLRAGGATSNVFVELASGDTLSASLDEEVLPMQEQSIGTLHRYVAVFQNDEPGTSFAVAFERTLDEGAPSSTMTLPEPFGFTAPAASFSRAEDLVLTWEPSGTTDTMNLHVDGSCVFVQDIAISGDPGTHTLTGGSLEPISEEAATQNCAIELTLTRARAGSLDPAYGEGGTAFGRQVRSFEITSTP